MNVTAQQALPDPLSFSRWFPFMVGFGLLVLVAVFWVALDTKEEAERRNQVAAESVKMIGYIESDIRSRIPALQRIVDRWQARGGTPEAEFVADARAYVADMPGFQAIEWVDITYHARWIVPLLGNEAELDRNLASNNRDRLLLEEAKHKRGPYMSEVTQLNNGNMGFLIYFPMYISGQFDGFLLVNFDAHQWLEYVFSLGESEEEIRNYRVLVETDGVEVYRQQGWESSTGIGLESEANFDFLGHKFTILCRPTTAFYRHTNTYLKEIVGATGILLSFVIAFAIHLLFKTSVEAWRAKTAQTSLQNTLNDLVVTRDELVQTYSSLKLATMAGRIGTWAWDIDQDKLKWNNLMYQIYDIPDDVVPSLTSWRRLIHSDDINRVESLMQQALKGEAVFETEYQIRRSSGEIRYIQAAGRVERDENSAPLRMTGVNWDITDRKLQEQRIHHLATHDTLTNLPSLSLVQERAELAIELAKRKKISTAIMFIDLDGFKNVNDSHGHDAGDAVLIEICKRLKSNIRKSDTVGRIGGDEFAVILTELDSSDNAAILAKKIIEAVNQPISHNGHLLSVGCSIGIACYPDDGADVEALLKKSDDAMYLVKKGGKNNFCFISDVLVN